MTRIIFPTLIALIFLSFKLPAQKLVTDRPDQTESSSTIPKYSIQIETGFLYQNGESRFEKQLLIPTILLRYGFTEIIELRLGEQIEYWPNIFNAKADFGISDLELGTKIQILRKENMNTEIAFLSHIILPTGTNSMSINKIGTVNKIAFSHVISPVFDVGYNVGYNNFGKGKGDFTYSSVLGIEISEKIATYIEVYGELTEFKNIVANFDSGLTYLLKPNMQIDLSFGLGLNTKMNYLALGFCWNIPTKKIIRQQRI